MSVSCEIIKDLLPLYYDSVCSKESREMIEEHLLECEDCSKEIKSIDEKLLIPDNKENLDEAKAVMNLSLKWKKGLLLSLLQGVILTIATVIAFACILYIFVGFRIVN